MEVCVLRCRVAQLSLYPWDVLATQSPSSCISINALAVCLARYYVLPVFNKVLLMQSAGTLNAPIFISCV